MPRFPQPWFAAAMLVIAGSPLFAQMPAPGPQNATALDAVAGAGLLRSQANTDLEELSDDIGARVTGSPAAERAIAWAVGKMKNIGLANVHTEPWTLDHGWQRGVCAVALIGPRHRALHADSMGWTGSTVAGGGDGDVIQVNANALRQETLDHAAQWNGKILLLRPAGPPPANPLDAFTELAPFLQAAHTAGALAVIAGQGAGASAGMNITHTGVVGFNILFQEPVVNLTAEDQLLLERLLDRGLPVRLHVDVENPTRGSTPSANVVGDIVGRTHPEQVVVIGGHLDSWDLSDGATDDGTGAIGALAAAQAILDSGQRPERTVRVVLFTGEEQGLLGSLAYVQRHKGEMANHVAALILDEGQGPISEMQMGGHDAAGQKLVSLLPLLSAFPAPKITEDSSFDTDSGPFILAGIPGINLSQDSPNYRFTHHSAVDTFDHVRQDVLVRNASELAVMAYYIADLPARLDAPWPPEQVRARLTQQHLEDMLKAFGIWNTIGQ